MRHAVIALTLLILASSSWAASPWVDGSVADALASAEASNKPVFLYWGAAWDPACNRLEQGLFQQAEFLKKMKEFVAIHVDADSVGAQALGETLAVVGYPTLIVLNSTAAEITRLPSDLSPVQFLEALDAAKSSKVTMPQVLAKIEATADLSKVPVAAWRLLGTHSWNQDRSVLRDTVELQKAFKALDQKIPATLTAERARLFTRWLGFAIRNNAGSKSADRSISLGSGDRSKADERAREILADPELVRRNFDFVAYGAGAAVRLLHPSPGSDRDRLVAAWDKAAAALRVDVSLPWAHRLMAAQPALELRVFQPRSERDARAAAVREEVLRLVAEAEKANSEPASRQATMPTAAWLLTEVGANDEATALLTRQLSRARAPSYFMSMLGKRAEDGGDKAGAVTWMRKGYEAASGGTARSEWGTAYLIALMKLTPAAEEAIRADSVTVLNETLGRSDAFAGGQARRMRDLAEGYRAWAKKQGNGAKSLGSIRKAVDRDCGKIAGSGEPAPRRRCEEFLAALGS